MNRVKLGAKSVGQSRARGWATLGRGWAIAGPEAIWDIKNRAPQVSCSAQWAKRQFWQLNQRSALICSLLREVWTFYEDQRSERGFAGFPSTGRIGSKPAHEQAQSAFRCTRRIGCRIQALALLGALLAPVSGSAVQWSSSGSFDLDETVEIRNAHAEVPDLSGGPWRSSSRADQWVFLDAFERSSPGKAPPAPATFTLPSGTAVEKLFALIAFAEAPKGRYDAIHHGAKTRPAKPPTKMTLAEIHTWIDQTPGQPHAIGNFQIIPSTLLNLQERLNLPDATLFDVAIQNRMAALLLADAGHQKFSVGNLSLAEYQNNLARIWAGLPLASGQSAYHGYAGNRATITRAFFDQQMTAIFGEDQKRIAKFEAQPNDTAVTETWNSLGE